MKIELGGEGREKGLSGALILAHVGILDGSEKLINEVDGG